MWRNKQYAQVVVVFFFSSKDFSHSQMDHLKMQVIWFLGGHFFHTSMVEPLN